MKKYILSVTTIGILFTSMLFTSCEKKKADLAPTETYKLIGRIDASRTTILSATLANADFTISYNSPNSFGEAQSVLGGNFKLTGYTGISVANTSTVRTPIANSTPPDTTIARTYTADTLSFFASQTSGPAISYLTVPTSIVSTYKTSVLPYPTSSVVFTNYSTINYVYNNSANASFTFNNFPFTNEITSALKEGRGYFRMGKNPNYVYILLDNVTKL
jgi:hypothetical protein